MLHFSLCSSSQEGGSYQQRILTEYLKGIQSRAEEIVQVLQSWAHKGTKVCSNIYRNNAFPQCYLHQISIWTLFTMCLCGFALLGLANFSSFPLQSHLRPTQKKIGCMRFIFHTSGRMGGMNYESLGLHFIVFTIPLTKIDICLISLTYCIGKNILTIF